MQLVAPHPASHDSWDVKSVAPNGTKVSFTEVEMEKTERTPRQTGPPLSVANTWFVLLEQCSHGRRRDYCLCGRTRHSHISPKVEQPKNLSNRGRGQSCWNSCSSPALVSQPFACHCPGQLCFNPVHCARE